MKAWNACNMGFTASMASRSAAAVRMKVSVRNCNAMLCLLPPRIFRMPISFDLRIDKAVLRLMKLMVASNRINAAMPIRA